MWSIDNLKNIDSDIIRYILSHLAITIIIVSLIVVVVYVVFAVFLNKLNKEMHGKTTWMAWVPVFNTFLLGKLTIHWLFGIILVIGLFVGIFYSINIPGLDKIYSVLPKDIEHPYLISYSAITFALYVYAHIKLKIVRNRNLDKDDIDNIIPIKKVNNIINSKEDNTNENNNKDNATKDPMIKLADIRANVDNNNNVFNNSTSNDDEIKELDDLKKPF